MSRNFSAFDIETVREFPDTDWRRQRPLGISCAVTRCAAKPTPVPFHGRQPNGSPSGQLSSDDAVKLVDHLCDLVSQGYTIVTWNGLGFDFDILAEESGNLERCRQLAWDHVDLMFQIFCENGYPVSLAKAAQGLGLSGKSMEGHDAPRLWREGQHQTVLDYVAEDARVVLQVAEKAERQGAIQWVTQKGGKKRMPLPNGWRTVRECERLPMPDTAWMNAPIKRRTFTDWLYSRPAKSRGPHAPRKSSAHR